MIVWRLALVLCLLIVPARGQAGPAEKVSAPMAGDGQSATAETKQSDAKPQAEAVHSPSAPKSTAESTCLMVESAARANAVPLEFFARVIWQESRFRADSVGPPTRNGERAQGIAQFMPATAAERRLLDPFDPVQALPKSAEFLRDLHEEFGNWGLAAAAYNAGPQRVRDFLAGTRGLPAQTHQYVLTITGRSVDDWAAGPPASSAGAPRKDASDCRTLMALLKRAPNRFVEALERRVTLGSLLPWGVQLNAGFSRQRVLTAYASLVRRFGTLLAQHDPAILKTTLRSRGTRAFYQVRVGTQTRSMANDLCARIEGAGGACMVLRNPRTRGAQDAVKARRASTSP